MKSRSESRRCCALSPSVSTARLASLLAPLARRQQDRVLHWADVATRNYGELGDLIDSRWRRRRWNSFDDHGFDAWALSGSKSVRTARACARRSARMRDVPRLHRGTRRGACSRVSLRNEAATRPALVQGLSGRPLALKIDTYPRDPHRERYFCPSALPAFSKAPKAIASCSRAWRCNCGRRRATVRSTWILRPR